MCSSKYRIFILLPFFVLFTWRLFAWVKIFDQLVAYQTNKKLSLQVLRFFAYLQFGKNNLMIAEKKTAKFLQ